MQAASERAQAPLAWREDTSAWAWRVVRWRNNGQAGMGDALVACVVCSRYIGLHGALDRGGEGAGAPMCGRCWAEASVEHADVVCMCAACIACDEGQGRASAGDTRSYDGSASDEAESSASGSDGSDEACGPRGLYDCPWCGGVGEGSVDDCVCGHCVCAVCADAEQGECSCGHEIGEAAWSCTEPCMFAASRRRVCGPS